MLLRTTRYFLKKMKEIPAETWIVKPTDASIPFSQKDQSHLDIKVHRDIKREFSRKRTDEALQPVSPLKGPVLVENPKIYDKIYRWCSCGMSLKQPFCDSSHEGTDFKPFKFTIEESVKDIKLCGCKLTTKKPFCDGKSCEKLKECEKEEKKN